MLNQTFSNETGVQQDDSVLSKVFKTTAYGMILVMSLVGNTLLILGIKRNINGRMRTVSNLLIASVAVSDLIMTVWSFPERMTRTITNDTWLIPGAGGSVLCKVVNFTEKLSISVSVLHLGALSLERFLAVFCPYKRVIKTRFVKYIICTIWIFSALYWSPILYYGKITDSNELRCEVRRFVTHWRHWYLVFIVVLCGVMLAILVLYTALAIHLCRRKDPSMKLASQRNKSVHIKRRVVLMVGVIIVTFYVCFLPYWIGWVWCSYASTMPEHICNQTYKFISIFLSYTSCMTNPIICLTFIGYFRLSFKAILMDPFNTKPHEIRLKFRRKSSATELDTSGPQPRKSLDVPKETQYLLLRDKHNSKQDHDNTPRNGSLPISLQTTMENNTFSKRNSKEAVMCEHENTKAEMEANSSNDIDNGRHNKDNITSNNDRGCKKSIDILTIYGTPL